MFLDTFRTADEFVGRVDVVTLIHLPFISTLPKLRRPFRLVIQRSTDVIRARGCEVAEAGR